MHQVYAVILTYNRKELLKRCLDAIYSQTRPCGGVIVVDNASHDGTQQQLLEANYPNLKVYVLSRNIGASGGFNAGFRLAYQNGADFVWMMDDDVIPKSDALQHLLAADERLSRMDADRTFLLSMALTESGSVTDPPALNLKTNSIGCPNWPEMVEYGMVPVQHTTFVSILVPRSTLADHGLPITSMFIWGEDTEYTLRITQDKPGFLVGASKVLHLRHESGPLNIITENDPLRIKYYQYFVRNRVFITRKYFGKYRALIHVCKFLFTVLRLLRRGLFRKAGIVIKGIMESIFFFPATEPVEAPIEALGASILLLEKPHCVAKKAIVSEAASDTLAEVELSSSFSELGKLR
ncbi:glycosyltransferase family 2 protein [Halomonas sp. IOP_31]|uniref:glycosyltransferase family 2 protein n=1 Tax=Halomonas sp. IOP_31 TaxID=2876584 RepID=UPI001E2CD55C|nr:glycosyltransferase family 2 protein [Halomonas sp. IOP_31]MCD6007020.1 glycosyltransferase family 2 protein [Halomonas sp. IOP_31]